MRRHEYVAILLATPMAGRMGLTADLQSSTRAEAFLELVARAFELEASKRPVGLT